MSVEDRTSRGISLPSFPALRRRLPYYRSARPAPLQPSEPSACLALSASTGLEAFERGVAELADGRWLVSTDVPPERRLVPAAVPGRLLVPVKPRVFDAIIRRSLAREVASESSGGLAARHPGASACVLTSDGQRRVARAMTALVIGPTLVGSGWGIALLAFFCGLLFTGVVVVQLALVIEHFRRVRMARAAPLPESALPDYGVIVPLRGEERILHRTLQRLDRLDYPRDRLTIRLAIDADDHSMLAAARAVRLPACISIVVVPEGRPRTKPRALNAALIGLKTDYVVVFDAEDEPDPLQLRKAAAAFAALPGEIACLQARLCIANTNDGLVPSLFTLEYAGLFDVIKPALAGMSFPVPLGGTSNHFRRADLLRIGGWDAWNVTEDADLGLRLARHGLRVADLDSTTLEEAPTTGAAWLKQRRRWMKGWMMTLLVHTRSPGAMLTELGLVPFLTTLLLLGGTIGGALLFPVLSGLYVLRLVVSGFDTSSLWSALTEAVGLLLLGAGVLSCMAAPWIGARERHMHRLLWLTPLMVLYTVPVWVATWLALWDIIRRPFHWDKTAHGLAETWTCWPEAERVTGPAS